MLLACVQFVVPLLRARVSSLYVSAWYILGGLTFTLLAYPVGNVVPEYLPGAQGATFSGLWIHDAVGLFVTPLALADRLRRHPRRLRAADLQPLPVDDRVLAAVPHLPAQRHAPLRLLVDPDGGPEGGDRRLGLPRGRRDPGGHEPAAVAPGPVWHGRGRHAAAFVWAGTVAYLVVSLQGSAQAIMPVNRFVHFSDWVIGHSHLAMIGFASFTALGGLLHAWRLTPGCRYNRRWRAGRSGCLSLGLAGMVLDLTAAGLVQGQLWQGDLPWMDSVRASAPFWWVRSVSGFVFLAGFLCVVAAMTTGPVVVPAPRSDAR